MHPCMHTLQPSIHPEVDQPSGLSQPSWSLQLASPCPVYLHAGLKCIPSSAAPPTFPAAVAAAPRRLMHHHLLP